MSTESSTLDAKPSPPHEHVRTEEGRKDLSRRSARSGFIQLSAQATKLVVALAAGMLLARLLTPEDFGLIAMVGSLTAFVNSFRDFGFPMATVHRKALDHQHVSTLFWITQKLNVLTVLFVALMAPVLAWFYGETRLVPITLVMAAGIFCLGFSFQHVSLLMRQMRFGTLTIIDLGSMTAGIAAALALAWYGAGYWALVAQPLVEGTLRSAGAWSFCPWRPSGYRQRLRSDDDGLRSLLSFGGDYSVYQIVTHVGRNLDRVLVGYFSGATAVGLYDNAYRWSLHPVQQVFAPMKEVVVSSFSRVQDDPAAYRASCRKGFLPLYSVTLPALTFMAVEAENVILVLLGDQWRAAVPLFRLLCIAAFAMSLTKVTKWIYLSQGETRRQLRWGFIYTPVMILAVALGVRWGAYGVAAAFTAATCLLTYPALAYCLKTAPLSVRDFLGIVARPALASFAAAAALVASRPLLVPPGSSSLVELPLTLALFGLPYLALWLLLPGGRTAARDVLALFRELLPKQKK